VWRRVIDKGSSTLLSSCHSWKLFFTQVRIAVKILYIHFGNVSKTKEEAECKLVTKACIVSKFRRHSRNVIPTWITFLLKLGENVFRIHSCWEKVKSKELLLIHYWRGSELEVIYIYIFKFLIVLLNIRYWQILIPCLTFTKIFRQNNPSFYKTHHLVEKVKIDGFNWTLDRSVEPVKLGKCIWYKHRQITSYFLHKMCCYDSSQGPVQICAILSTQTID
jgi:hypothetical protein